MTKIINFTNVNPYGSREILQIKSAIHKVISKKDFILGDSVKIFEKKYSKISKIKYSVGCASGTDALHLALKSLNLKKDDEVIVPAMTYISSGLSVLLNNNKLVCADIDENTGLISLTSVLKNISKNTRAIIPVNLYGQKVDLKKLRNYVGNKIYIIEDSAQSHFAYSCSCKNPSDRCCKKNRNEKYADISCYSFYPAKNLGAFGDAGLVATNNSKLYNKILALRNLGSIKKHKHDLLGLNSRLDTLQAAILNIKLKSILQLNNKRRALSKIYDDRLKYIKQIKLTRTNIGSSRHLYVIKTKKRNLLLKYLLRKGIFSQIHYPYSIDKLKPFRKLVKSKTKLKNAQNWANECLSLPLHPEMKVDQVKQVVNAITRFFQ